MKFFLFACCIILIFLGGCLFVFGGYDDSPGAQGLGILIGLGGATLLYKREKKTN
jgi:hypothetical protein